MHSARINTLTTSQDQPCYVWHHTKHNHAAGDGSVTVHVSLPKTRGHVGGFPVGYHVSVTPSQPAVVVSVSNKVADGFDVTLSTLNGASLAAGTFSALVIG